MKLWKTTTKYNESSYSYSCFQNYRVMKEWCEANFDPDNYIFTDLIIVYHDDIPTF